MRLGLRSRTTDCAPGLGCLTNDTFTDGFRSVLCEAPGDPTGCGETPGAAAATCVTADDGPSVCALDCNDGSPCPNGMVCNDAICL